MTAKCCWTTAAQICGCAKSTLGRHAESSSIPDDLWRSISTMPGVVQAANITYLTMQVGKGERDGARHGGRHRGGRTGHTGLATAAGCRTPDHAAHYEAVADIALRLPVGRRAQDSSQPLHRRGLTRRMVSSSGDPMVFIPLKDAQEAQFLKDNDAILMQRRRTPQPTQFFNRPGVPGLFDAVIAAQTGNNSVNAVLIAH